MREARIAVLAGDGIGPEVTEAALAVCRAATEGALRLSCEPGLIGGAALEATGDPLPEPTLRLCRAADAVFLGAVGGPQWEHASPRPESGLLRLRQELHLYGNLRPVKVPGALAGASPLREDIVRGADILFVRELTGGIYFGDKGRSDTAAHDTCTYTVAEIERIVRLAARLATDRRGRLTSVDKANVLETSRLWREVTTRVVADEFPHLELEHVLVDAMAMHLLRRPRDFDVVVTENMFGDILTDEASMLAGSLGMLPSASLGAATTGLFEPIHGSAPDLAGKNLANPYGAILSGAMMLRLCLGQAPAADRIEAAVARALEAGHRTPDLVGEGDRAASTEQVTAAVLDQLAG